MAIGRAIVSAMAVAIFPRPIAAPAQAVAAPTTLTLEVGRTLDIRLDQRVTIRKVGQDISGVVTALGISFDLPGGRIAGVVLAVGDDE